MYNDTAIQIAKFILNLQLSIRKSFSLLVLDKNLCRPNPCKNDGQCVETSTSYRCYCRPGFIGKACESQITRIFFLYPCILTPTTQCHFTSYKRIQISGIRQIFARGIRNLGIRNPSSTVKESTISSAGIRNPRHHRNSHRIIFCLLPFMSCCAPSNCKYVSNYIYLHFTQQILTTVIQTHVKTGAPANSEWDFTNASVTSNIRGNFVNVSNYNEVVLKWATSRGYRAFKSILPSLTTFIHTNQNGHVG